MDLSVPERSTLKQLGLRACSTCVKAKVKCVPNPQQNRKCKRCQRLDKQCEPAAPSFRKRTQPQHVVQLEKKLDDLVNLLSKSKDQAGVIDQAQLSMTGSVSHTSPTTVHQPHQASTFPEPSPGRQSGLGSSEHDTGPSSSTGFQHSSQTNGTHFQLPYQESAFLLLEFRTSMAHQFPFVVVPPEATSESLRAERPMLWKAILTAASCLKPSQQEAMGLELVEEFSTRLLLKGEKSLDLLQSILIYLAWSHYHSVVNPQLVNLMSLTKALVANLGYQGKWWWLNIKDRRLDPIEGADGTSKEMRDASFLELNSKTLEEWRALAGCFFLSVITFSACKKTEPLPFTPHLKECCERLVMFREYESDKLLVQFVEIQRISLKISSIFNELNDYPGTSGLPLRMFMKSMQGELDNFKRNLPFELQHHPDILCYYQSAEISLYETGLSRAFNNEDDKSYRLSVLYSFLLAVKTFFSTNLTRAFPMTAARAYITNVQVEYAIRMGIKALRIPATDGWDAEHARVVLDFPSAMEMAIGKLEAIIKIRSRSGEQPSSHDGHDVFHQYLNNMRCLKNWSESLEPSSGDLRGGSGTKGSQQAIEHERQDLELPDPTSSAVNNAQSFSDNFLMITNSDNFLWEALNCENDDWMAFGS